MEHTRGYLDGMTALLRALPVEEIDNATALLWDNYQGGRRAVFCGNGGSAASAFWHGSCTIT